MAIAALVTSQCVLFSTLLGAFRHSRKAEASRKPRQTRSRATARRRMHFEWLEPRRLLTVFHVPVGGTIQTAINAASAGDTVDIAAGTYLENLVVQKSGIIIQGAGEGQTIIDGQQRGTVVTFENVDSTTMLTECTIQNGLGDGGGIRIVNASPIIRHNEIADNFGQTGNGYGEAGGIYVGGGQCRSHHRR